MKSIRQINRQEGFPAVKVLLQKLPKIYFCLSDQAWVNCRSLSEIAMVSLLTMAISDV